MIGHHTVAILDALDFYEAVRDGNDTNQLQVVRDAPPGSILLGLVSLCGSLLQTAAARSGSSEDEFIEALRAAHLDPK